MNEHNQITPTHSTSLSDIVQPSPLRRHLAILTLIAYIGQPLVATAEIIASQGAAANNRPTVDATANGLPLVQIATPSAAGVSHNQYSTFNVDPAGVILNNAQNTALTQQAGYVTANPNLVNGAARVILNEVTSTNRSQLNGYTEVAGQQAEVIIANPNGISCNGCGFINTSRGILTTGTPVIGAGGSLDAFRVTSGDIQIGTAGLNAANLTQLDLITRSVQVNGELWANNLNVITGNNQVDYTTLGVQIIQGQGTAPTVSIDVAQLGGMYANKIRLIGTEAGVGVNSTGTLAAQAGDFTLDTQGQITLTGKTTATANLSLNSATGIANSGTLYAQQNATLTSTGSITNSGLTTAQGNLALNAATLNSTGTLGAGIDANGNATQAGVLTLITQGQTIATGYNIAGRNISITATDINLANSRTQAPNNISLIASSGNIDLSSAQTQAIAGNLTATASGTLNNSAGNLEAGSGITFTANSLNNAGGSIKNLGGNLNITTTQDIINTASNSVSGFIGSNGNLTLNAASINSTGTLGAGIDANGNATQASDLTIITQGQTIATGYNIAGRNISISATDINLANSRTQAANNISLSASAGNLDISGAQTQAIAGNLTATASGTLNNSAGNLEAGNGITLTANSLNNAGGSIKNLGSTSALNITTTQNIINTALNGVSGFIGSNGNLTLTTAALNNSSGKLYAFGNFTFDQASATLDNSAGEITSNGNTILNLASINNQGGTVLAAQNNTLTTHTANGYSGLGTVAAYGNNSITLQGDYTHLAGNVFAANGNMTLTVIGNLTNQTVLEALGTLTVSASNINNNAAGKFNAGVTSLSAVTGDITNDGRIEGSSVNTTSVNFTNNAVIFGDFISLTTSNNFTNQGVNAIIGANDTVNLWVTNQLSNLGGAEIFSVNGDINIAKDNVMDANGNYINQTQRILNGNSTLAKSSVIDAGRNLNISANVLDNTRTVSVTSNTVVSPASYMTPPAAYAATQTAGALSPLFQLAASLNNYTPAGNAVLGSTGLQGGFFSQDITGLNATNKTFQVIGGEPLTGAPTVYYESMAASSYAASQYTIITFDWLGNPILSTHIIKNSDIVSSTANNVNFGQPPGYTVTLIDGTVFNFDTLDKQGQYFNVSYFPGYNPNVNIHPSQLVTLGAPTLTYYETSRTTGVSTTTDQLAQPLVAEARLLASGNMNLNIGTSLTNTHSTITAGRDITISGTTTTAVNGAASVTNARLTNTATNLNSVVTTNVTAALGGWNPCGGPVWNRNSNWCWVTTSTTIPPTTASTTIQTVPSSVTAGGTLTANANTVSNTSASGTNSQITGSTLGATIGSTTVAGTGATAPSAITLPTSGLYTIHSQPGQQYLVVTDPRFTNYKQFLSSDYMLNRLTLDPTITQKRLGDGFYEQRLINDQITQLSGRRFIGEYTSTEEQIQALMDSGIAAAQDLKLTPGIALTKEQITALKHDIVWMETSSVTLADGNSIQVLVPKVYLTQLHAADLQPDGALIAANVIDINTSGTLANSGNMRSSTATVLTGHNIQNSGSIDSQGLTLLNARNDIVNTSGSISGNNVMLSAKHDILNTTATQTIRVGNANLGASNTLIGNTGSIDARNNLNMVAGNDLTITGAAISAGNDAVLRAGNNLTMNTIVAEATSDTHTGSFNYATKQTTNIGSGISTGGNLSLVSGKDMHLTSAQIAIGQNALLASGGDITVDAAKDTASLNSNVTASNSYSSTKTYDETVVGSTINATGNVTLAAIRSADALRVDTTRFVTPKAEESAEAHNAASTAAAIETNKESAQQKTSSEAAANDSKAGASTPADEHKKAPSDDQQKPDAHDDHATPTQTARTDGKGNINLKSASISSQQGKVALISDADVNIGVTEELHTSDQFSYKKDKGLLSSKSTTTSSSSRQSIAVGSNLSADSITVNAGKAGAAAGKGNINVIGSSIAATNDVTLDAANDITIAAGTDSYSQSSESYTKETGLMSNGGMSFSIGKRETTDKQSLTATQQSQNRSVVGSLGGNLTLKAGHNATVSGSDIAAAKDINVTAQDITINSGLDDSTNTQSHDTKQSGLTVALNVGAVNTAQTVQQMGQAYKQSKDNRTKALAAMAGGLAIANGMSGLADVSVSATVGSSQSHSDSTQTSTRNSGSTVKAGGNLNLTATAAKGEGGNITIQGSDIKAGRDISLDASNNINLLADQDTSSQVSHNSSSSSGAGVSISKAGPGITANASKAHGNSDGHDVTNIATQLTAGNTLRIKSGKDTNLIGATANGKQIIADVGGDLNIASVQDTSTYASKQESISGSGTVSLSGNVNANVNASQQKINGNYASVKTQSGLKAGDGGFQVTVKGNTDLKGGVIASTDKAVGQNNNTFTTATLTQSDLTNVASYDAQSLSVGVGTNGVTPPMALNAKDKDSSVTRSGISGANISITNTEKQKQLTGKDSGDTLASINRDVSTDKDTSGAINNNLNVQEIQTGFAVTQAFVQQANTFVAVQAQKSDVAKAALKEELKKPAEQRDEAKIAQLSQSIQDTATWGMGGTGRTILTAVTAAASGNVSGGANQLVQASAVNYLQSLGVQQIKQIADNLMDENGQPTTASESVRTALQGIAACAGAAAQGGDCNAAAMGASSAVVLNNLMGDTQGMTTQQKEERKNLISTLVTGITAAAGGDAAMANAAAQMELVNNGLVEDSINAAKRLGNQAGNGVAKLMDKITVKELADKKEVIKAYLESKSANGGLTDTEIAFLATIYAADEALFPTTLLDIPGVGRAISSAGKLIKADVAIDDALKVAAVEGRAVSTTSWQTANALRLNPVAANKQILDRLPAGAKLEKSAVDGLNNNVIAKGNDPSYLPGTQAYTYTTTTSDKFVRVYSAEGGNQTGGWMMRESDIAGLSPAQIKDKFALLHMPSQITDVTIPPGQAMRASTANNIMGGSGGGVQFEIVVNRKEDINPGWFTNSRSLR